MTTIAPLENEAKRLEALKKFDILDTPRDGSYDRITALAAMIFKVPIAIISLVDTDRIWFKSHFGLPVHQINREPGLCASAILSPHPYIIENAVEDPRTLTNSLVAGEFGLKFYAAVPLQTEDNYNLGTLCIIDKAPRSFSKEETEVLETLGKIVMDEMEMRLALRNTVNTIKHISADISGQLTATIKNMDTGSVRDEKEKILSYLDDSRLFMQNLENQLNHLS